MEVEGGYFWAEQLFSSHDYWNDDDDYGDYFIDGEEFVFEISTPSSTGQPEDFPTSRYEVDQDCESLCEGTIRRETVAFSECPVITAPRQCRLEIPNARCIDVASPRQGPRVSAATDSRFLPPLHHISLGQFLSLFLLPLHPNKFVDSEQFHFPYHVPYRDTMFFGYTRSADYGEYGGLYLAAPAHTEESDTRMSRGYDSLPNIVGPDTVSKADTKVDLELRIA